MRIFCAFLVLLLFPVSVVGQSPPGSFYSAKKLLAEVHEEIGHMETIYCGCPYDRTTVSGGDVDRDACRLEARNTERRSDRVEWEHVVPASWFGETRACWQLTEKAYPEECEDKSGRECCQVVNDWFDIAHNDPNNLFPSSGEVNGDRSNYPYGDVPGEERAYGQCDFEMGKRADGIRVAEPSDSAVRGVLARAMLYMSQVYGANVQLPLEIVWEWHLEYPPEAWEIKRAQLIADRTALRNQWILDRN